MKIPPFISIVIPNYNEVRYIENLLLSLKNQIYANDLYEIIVVDNGSTDGSHEKAKKYADKIFANVEGTVARIRNIGAQHAKGDLFAFIDSDCIVESNWLNNASLLYNNGYRVFGCKVDVPVTAGWLERAWFSQRYNDKRQVPYINSANFFIGRDAFFNINGFREDLVSGEDWDICNRLSKAGYPIWSSPSVKAIHMKNPKNILSFMRREMWHGVGGYQCMKFGDLDKVTISTLTFLFCTIFQIIGFIFNMQIFLISTFIIIILISIAGVYNVIRYKIYKQFITLTFLYYFYFLARSTSMLYKFNKYLN